MNRRWLLLPLAAVLLFYAYVGSSYVINNHWPDGDDIIMDEVFLPAATWSAPAQFQMSEYNEIDVIDNSHPFRINLNPQMSFGANDNDNTAGFLGEAGLNSEYGLSYAAALAWAVCWPHGPGGTYDECDVMLDPTLGWSLNPNNSTWFQSTVLHELGHVRGLGHYNSFLSMQNSGQSKYLRNEILYMDDKVGVRQNASFVTERDIVIYEKWHDGAVPRWMSMSPTTLREGQVVNLNNITVENRGTQSFASSVRFGVYLSTNDIISTGDQLLNTGSFASFGTFSFSTFNWSATMPSMSDCSTRYIGGIIDDNNVWAERFEGNNDVVFTNGVPYTGSSYTPTPLTILLALDSQEPNDSFGGARTVTPPFSASNLSLDDDSDEDWFRFTTDCDGDVSINATFSDASGDIDLQLRDGGNGVVATSSTTTDNEAIAQTVPAGTYYARLYGFGSGACNEYALSITGPTCDCPAIVALSDRSVFPERNAAQDLQSTLYAFRDGPLADDAAGRHLRELFEQHAGRIAYLFVVVDPGLRGEFADILKALGPALHDLTAGVGDQVTIDAYQLAKIQAFLERLAISDRVNGGGSLADAIDLERARMPWDRLSGRTVGGAWNVIAGRPARPSRR